MVEQGAHTATLVEVNGPGVLVTVGIPLAVAVACTLLLRRHRARGGRASYRVAWALLAALAAFTALAMFSIGTFMAPAVVLLAGAALLSRGPAST